MSNYADRAIGFCRGRWSVLTRVWNHPLNRGSRFIAVRDYLLWNMVRFSMDARHVVRLPGGLEIILGKKENYGSTVYTHCLPDYSELLFLTHCLRDDDLFADVGANVGLYSIWVAGSTGAKVISFEPVPETFHALNQNIRLNKLCSLVHAEQVAIGEVVGEVLMTAVKGGLDHVIAKPSASDPNIGVRVPSNTLDGALLRLTPFALKIDVEGYELHVLKGGQRVLRDPRLKVLVIEVQDWTLNKFDHSEQEVLSAVRALGFVSYVYDPFTRVLVPRIDESQLNYLFIRPADQPEINTRLSKAARVTLPGYPMGV